MQAVLADTAGNLAARVNDYYARMRGTVSDDYDYSKAPTVADGRGHYTDAGKLPTHPTFSVGSEYSNDKTPGGIWSQGPGQQTYTPSAWMVQQPGRMEGLARYMVAHEPNVILNMSAPYKPTDVRLSLSTPEGRAYAAAKVKEFEAQDKPLVDTSDHMGLVGVVGPAARSIKNVINSNNILYKPVNAGWGAFLYEQGLENAVQDQLQKDK